MRGTPILMKFFRGHVRFWISVLLGIVTSVLLPASLPSVVRLLISWNCGVVVFLTLIWSWMTRLPQAQMMSRCEEEDETAGVLLLFVSTAALLSLVAIVALLATVKQFSPPERSLHVALATLTIVGAWILVPTMFTLHYADMFYSEPAERRPLIFPQTDTPTFWDFVYFSFTIAAACQTSDITTTNVAVRKVVTAHSILSFVFNISILGFAFNVSAGMLGG